MTAPKKPMTLLAALNAGLPARGTVLEIPIHLNAHPDKQSAYQYRLVDLCEEREALNPETMWPGADRGELIGHDVLGLERRHWVPAREQPRAGGLTATDEPGEWSDFYRAEMSYKELHWTVEVVACAAAMKSPETRYTWVPNDPDAEPEA